MGKFAGAWENRPPSPARRDPSKIIPNWPISFTPRVSLNKKHHATHEILAISTPCLNGPCKFPAHTIQHHITVLTARSIGRPPNYRFKEAIFAGPVRSLEQWGALTADDWAEAANMMDENPNWNVQHVIDHFVGPAPVEPPQIEPPVDHPPKAPKRSLKELPMVNGHARFQIPCLNWQPRCEDWPSR